MGWGAVGFELVWVFSFGTATVMNLFIKATSGCGKLRVEIMGFLEQKSINLKIIPMKNH